MDVLIRLILCTPLFIPAFWVFIMGLTLLGSHGPLDLFSRIFALSAIFLPFNLLLLLAIGAKKPIVILLAIDFLGLVIGLAVLLSPRFLMH